MTIHTSTGVKIDTKRLDRLECFPPKAMTNIYYHGNSAPEIVRYPSEREAYADFHGLCRRLRLIQKLQRIAKPFASIRKLF